MASGVVTVGRHRYAVGLYWENSPGGGHVAQIAKEAARQPGQQADFYVIRRGTKDRHVPQFGLCAGEAGQKAGMPVLAGCLASQIPGSWAGAFRLNEGVAVIIVRDDLIVPDGDLFFTDESDARERLIQEIGFGGLQTIYAPEAWSIPGADTIPLTLLISNRTDIQLQRVSIPPKVKMAIAAGALAFAIILGIVWAINARLEKERTEREEGAKLAANLPQLFQQQQPKPEYIRYWEDAPLVNAILSACKEGLSLIPSGMSGWNLTSMSCSGSSLSLSWSRTKGITEPPLGAHVDDSGGIATKSISMKALEKRGHEDLLNIEDITKRYLLQTWPGSIARAPDDPPPPPPPGYNGQWTPPPAPWVKRSFTLTVPELPGGLPGYIGDIPGAMINSMSYTPNGVWTIQGVIYENRR